PFTYPVKTHRTPRHPSSKYAIGNPIESRISKTNTAPDSEQLTFFFSLCFVADQSLPEIFRNINRQSFSIAFDRQQLRPTETVSRCFLPQTFPNIPHRRLGI